MASDSPPPPPLSLLATLPTSSGNPRIWQSAPHPSPSVPLLATASSDKSVSIFSLRDFRLLSTITGGHKRSVRAVGWKDYGQPKRRRSEANGAEATNSKPVVLATGSFDANVGIWIHNDDYNKSNDESLAPEVDGHDELEMAVGDKKEDEEEWNFSTLLTGPDSEIKSLTFSPPHYSANLLATSSRDKSVWVWEEVEEDEWETVAVLQEHTGDVKCVAWNRGAKRRREGSQDEDAEDVVVSGREILASGSYDDTIRLWRDDESEGDWICVGVLEGHEGTVWGVCWEPRVHSSLPDEEVGLWEPRLLSCSDDLSLRIWRRVISQAEREKQGQVNGAGGGRRLPNIIRPPSSMENWETESVLPEVHVRSVYAVDWSARSGLVVSCGGDGTIVVYKEVTIPTDPAVLGHRDGEGDVIMNGSTAEPPSSLEASISSTTNGPDSPIRQPRTKWEVVAQLDMAHDEFEINHVCWALRRDAEKRTEGEEIVVSTGDDGVVRVWTLPQEVL